MKRWFIRNSCIYKIAGTDTFRLSSTKLFKKWGSNLQNIEKSVRKIYVPDEGNCFVQVDQSGAEALIVAYCCPAGNYRQLFIHGVKPHTYLAIRLFKHVWPLKMREANLITSYADFDIEEILATPIAQLKSHRHWQNLSSLVKDSDDWSLQERYYYLAKQTEHSSNYDIQFATFRMNVLEKSGGKIVISEEDAKIFLDTKHGLYPEIKSGYHRYVEKCVTNARCLYNLMGHPLEITEREINEKTLKEFYAIIPQSTVGEITNMAVSDMYSHILENNLRWDILANTHDSYLLQCPIDEALACANQSKVFIEREMVSPIDGVKFNMRSEASIGMNWASHHKLKNPIGMKAI